MKHYHTVVVIVLIILLSSCGREHPSSPYNEEETLLAPLLLVIPDNKNTFIYKESDSLYTIKYVGDVYHITRGNIVASTKMEGLLKKVQSLRATFKVYHLVTEPSWLTDVVRNGALNTSLAMSMVSSVNHESPPIDYTIPLTDGGINLGNMTLYRGEYEGEELEVSITEGYINFNPTAEAEIKITGNDTRKFKTNVEGTIEFRCILDIDASGVVEISEEIPLANFKEQNNFYMEEFPIPEALSLFLSLGLELETGGSGRWRVTFEDKTGIDLEAKYQYGNWADTTHIEHHESSSSLDCDSDSDIKLHLSIRHLMEFLIYSERVTSFDMNQLFKFTGSVNYPPVTEWESRKELTCDFSFHPNILDRRLTCSELELSGSSTVIASGPYATDFYLLASSWGEEGGEDGQFNSPSGLDTDGQGNVLICDTRNHRIQKFTSSGIFLYSWGTHGSETGNFSFPCDISSGPDGCLYVVDRGNCRIQKFASDTTFITSWGTEGENQGEFKNPTGIAVDKAGNVYVTDYDNHNIQKFSEDGDFIMEWGSYGTGNAELDCPAGIAAGENDTIYVTECHNNRVQIFSADGTYIRKWGQQGEGDSQFNCPIDITVDAEGKIYVLDNGNSRMQKFSSPGDFITTLGSMGTSEGSFDSPEGIALDSNGYIYIADTRNNRIQKFIPKQQ